MLTSGSAAGPEVREEECQVSGSKVRCEDIEHPDKDADNIAG